MSAEPTEEPPDQKLSEEDFVARASDLAAKVSDVFCSELCSQALVITALGYMIAGTSDSHNDICEIAQAIHGVAHDEFYNRTGAPAGVVKH